MHQVGRLHGLGIAEIGQVMHRRNHMAANTGRHNEIEKHTQVCLFGKHRPVGNRKISPQAPVHAIRAPGVDCHGHRDALQLLRDILFSQKVEQISMKLHAVLIGDPFRYLIGIGPDPAAVPTTGLQFQGYFFHLSSQSFPAPLPSWQGDRASGPAVRNKAMIFFLAHGLP